jgi:hypothetical protein
LIIITLIVAAPVIAQDDTRFNHTIDFKIGGLITIDRQLGHACTTGAVKNQTVRGYGEMTKHENIRIAQNIMAIDETSDWSVPAGALSGLTVTTTIRLCSRPLSAAAETYSSPSLTVYQDDLINIYHPSVVNGDISVYGLTAQLWSTQIMTNPGHEGSYHADFIAAYGPGPYEKMYGATDKYGNTFYYDEDFMWEYRDGVSYLDRDHKTRGYKRGDYYVGNYFNIEQYAYTSDGLLRRFISLSNPFEPAYLEEDLEVIGMAAVREALRMHNLKGGPKAVTLAWYELF